MSKINTCLLSKADRISLVNIFKYWNLQLELFSDLPTLSIKKSTISSQNELTIKMSL